ncbi:MAG: outer membrane beta-barrel protein [Nitrospiraceae bacterium]
MSRETFLSSGIVCWMLWLLAAPGGAREATFVGLPPETQPKEMVLSSSQAPKLEPEKSDWRYGGFADLGYSLNFNFPQNHLWRNRSTTPRVNELDLNMAGASVRKDVTEQSRWGMELLVQGGQDAKDFGFHVNQPKVGSSDQLRHFGRANLSYLAPVGNGLTVQAGLFNSLIGYDSLYAKDNINYTRPWIGDYSPYLMFGVNASYPFSEHLTGSLFVINSYFHLSRPNDQPSYGGQFAYKATRRLTIKETVYYGPQQADTSLEFWRLFFDTIAEWKGDGVTVAFEHQIGTENLAVPGSPRTFWTGAMIPVQWNFSGPWSVAIRPEFYWDRNGRLTGFEQLVKAMTTTLGYRVPYGWTNTLLRLEHRYDESTGAGGGFFKGGEVSSGVIGLTSAQHMLIFSAIWTFDSP